MALSESLSGSSGRKSPLNLREDLSKIYDSFFLESTLMAEYCQLLKHPVPGVYILPSSVSSLIWYGIICLRVGIYKGGIFKFRVSIPANYPDGGCPEFDFQAGVYHPQVDLGTGQLDTKKEFQRWRRDVNHIHHLLKYAKSIFNNVDVHDPCNGEAAKLFRTDLERYKQKVAESIEQCREDTLSPDSSDPHSIKCGISEIYHVTAALSNG
ncbi:protein AKTIP homolog isoform X2 [Halichondria panicea]|uniref:protein AKTIP homolog isoform X2 n=1 Tax=Halichondria panicea TaxID=6063 RepID=UPI00312B9FFE